MKTIYELVGEHGADITYIASSDKVAYYCAVVYGKGRCNMIKHATNGMCETFFSLVKLKEEQQLIKLHLGSTIDEFASANRHDIAQALNTFQAIRVKDRRSYDELISKVKSPLEIKNFKESYLSNRPAAHTVIVKSAWRAAKRIIDEVD
jgi:hypothetical protein